MTTLLISAGTAFSASSPLHYTLCLDNKYAHTGLCKENFYLYSLQEGVNIEFGRDTSKNKPPQMTITHGCEELYGRRSINSYIRYYQRLWEHIKTDYQAVADFSNQNACLTEKFMKSIKPNLLKCFNVKVIMIFRDPIRRLWSVCNKGNIREFRRWVSGELEPNAMYSDIYKKYRNVWGEENVHMIVMEELWENKTQALSDFLDFPINTIHENVYYPERGTKAPHYKYLRDQWISDKHDLDVKTWEYAMSNMGWVYKDFKDTFGYIPDKWGQWYET